MSMEALAERSSNVAVATSLLDQAITATKQTEPSRAEELIRTLTEEALKGTVSWNKNLTVTFNEAIAAIDSVISRQLAAIMHNQQFQQLEGSWRGLHHLVSNSETSSMKPATTGSLTCSESRATRM